MIERSQSNKCSDSKLINYRRWHQIITWTSQSCGSLSSSESADKIYKYDLGSKLIEKVSSSGNIKVTVRKHDSTYAHTCPAYNRVFTNVVSLHIQSVCGIYEIWSRLSIHCILLYWCKTANIKIEIQQVLTSVTPSLDCKQYISTYVAVNK